MCSSISFQPRELLSQATPYLIPSAAASGAIVPLFFALVQKSALQAGLTPPPFSLGSALSKGLRASPAIGFIVGSQILMQEFAERYFTSLTLSSLLVGAGSAPALAIFNGLTLTPKQSPLQSLRALTRWQVIAITSRETTFLLSLRISTFFNPDAGDQRGTKLFSQFISGAVGSLCGHPFDTMLTRQQKGLPFALKDCMRGAGVKAVALGLFSPLFHFFNETLKEKLC